MYPFSFRQRAVEDHNARNHERSTVFFMALVSLWLAICNAVAFGIGYWILYKSSSTCSTSMHTLIQVATWASLAALCVHVLGFVVSLLGLIAHPCAVFAKAYNTTFGILTQLLAGLLSVALFIWAVIVLSRHECEETYYWIASIVIAVATGITILSSLCRCCF